MSATPTPAASAALPEPTKLLAIADRLRRGLDAEWPREDMDIDAVLAAEMALRAFAALSAPTPAAAGDTREALAAKLRGFIGQVEFARRQYVLLTTDEAKAILAALTEQPAAPKPRFQQTSCSQCGVDLGPGDSGVSHCWDHAAAPQEPQQALADAIHYPDCWDMEAYPTLESALSEVAAGFHCTNQDTCAAPAQEPQQPVAWRPKLACPINWVTGTPREGDLRHWVEGMGCEIEYAYAAASSPAPAVQPASEALTPFTADVPSKMLDLAKRWADNKIHTYRFAAEAERIMADAIRAATQPEAVAELVGALTTARPYVEYASSQFYDGVGGQSIRDKAAVRLAALDALIAKHGQPQGGSNA